MLPPGSDQDTLTACHHPETQGEPFSKVVSHAFPSDIKGIGTLKLYGNDLFLWIYYGFVVVWYWRGVGERRVACELILDPCPAEFCANYRPNVVVILETDKSNTWHKKANKNRDLWQITATHLPSLAGARVQSDKLIMRNSMELQNVTLCWLINFPRGPSFKQANYTLMSIWEIKKDE